MKEYIDKAAIKAKINNWIKDARSRYTLSKVQFSLSDRIESLENLLSFLDTLEVKEVDVEKESELIANSIMISVQANLYHTNVYDYKKRCYKHSDLKDAARKGIELGLKAKEE